MILCLKEPEILLKRAAAQTLSYIAQHNEQLAQPVAENGLDTITFFLSYNDTQLKRNMSITGKYSKAFSRFRNPMKWPKLTIPENIKLFKRFWWYR